jgi:diguanylate cyclase (GGDEF)-like protein
MTTEPVPAGSPAHPLLARQLAACGVSMSPPTQAQWNEFVERVQQTYQDSDRSTVLLERALEVSTREFSAIHADIQEQAAQSVANSRHRLQLVFDSVTTALVVIERSGRIAAANPEALRLFGDIEDVIDQQVDDVVQLLGRDGQPRPLIHSSELDDVLLSGQWTRNSIRLLSATAKHELQQESADSSDRRGTAADIVLIPFSDDEVCVGGLLIVTDNAEREEARERLSWQASHDPMTGLLNRSMLSERIELALVGAQRSGAWPSVLFCDLDRFKNINDSLGHQAGDKLLKAAAQRLLGCVRSIDTVARLGGDEFVILCESAGDTNLVRGLAERILAAMGEPFDVADEETFVSVSIGIAHSDPRYTTADTLLHDADLSMYRAKERGRNCYDVADDGLRSRAVERVLLERSLRSAIAANDIGVSYQPLRRADDESLVGFEALARWHHPVLGNVRPDRFIPVAEETGLVQALTDRMLDIACRDVATWNADRLGHGIEPLVVHVNVSGRDLQSPTLLGRVRDALRRYDVPAHWLILEITETMLLDDPDKALERLRELKLAGVKVAIDDFGTGYSSLAYLRRFPVHMIKIDREFVSELASSTQDQCIVRAMIDLARGLDYVVLAEGVETGAELAVLRALGCQLVQGYLIGRPMASDEALQLATRTHALV